MSSSFDLPIDFRGTVKRDASPIDKVAFLTPSKSNKPSGPSHNPKVSNRPMSPIAQRTTTLTNKHWAGGPADASGPCPPSSTETGVTRKELASRPSTAGSFHELSHRPCGCGLRTSPFNAQASRTLKKRRLLRLRSPTQGPFPTGGESKAVL